MSLAAGRLHHRVTLQSPQIAQSDTDGSLSVSWTTEAKAWASIEPVSVRDFVAAAAIQSQVTARITLRYRDDIRPDWRVVHGNRIYTISGILRDARTGTEYLTLAVTEGTNEGGP